MYTTLVGFVGSTGVTLAVLVVVFGVTPSGWLGEIVQPLGTFGLSSSGVTLVGSLGSFL